MSGSFFKDILDREIRSVFLNPAEFAESVTLEGRTLDAVVDRPETTWPEADDRPGVSHRLVVLSVALSDFPDELYPGTSVTFNGERWFVATADREALRTIRLYREAA
ncbi:nitrate reductase [uncultured Bilophila sp.]|uniref:head-tail joining protein n=1 Tax=uncultured Bilophila sp. TaxID=529385 RepID=UPI0026DB3506|nr:nitrate reductase [uncultured Bilophila sp.]